ncbi:MAG: hypothetical protein LBR22_11645 [Desulfovibrio sp.]|jgi:hypothetical protein|nr:hypothetical protein [Desulfovibrio sp.]
MGVGIYGMMAVKIDKYNGYTQSIQDPFIPAEGIDGLILRPEIFFNFFKPFACDFDRIIMDDPEYQIHGNWEKDFDKFAQKNDLVGYIRCLRETNPYISDFPTYIKDCGAIGFYAGSNKARMNGHFLRHMQLLVRKAINNPLSQLVYFTLL